ncbi:MAG: CoA transferase [Chloroflexi bacterium]|nr:CoA transferase [Chloroflexota bacterium]MCY3587879.1 CoA transferase [Chloroflexota bacterium]MDE2708558.1 CoA transferase [Chloroflexota bacterium]
MPDSRPGPLANVRVIDLTDDRAIYAGKLIADLGAQVVRVEPAGGDPLRQRGPFHGNGASLWHGFFASSRDFQTEEPDSVSRLARSADVILDCERLSDPEALLEANPRLVIVDVTSFGRSGPWTDYQAPGLVAEALGGVAATSGDADTPPLKLYGDQYAFVGGVYAAVGALAALNHARETGQGQIVRLSTHQALGSILEHVLMWAWHHEMLPFADGPVLPRQGSLHWSNAYVVMQAIGGSIMITPTPDFSKQVAWLIEEGTGMDLLDERFSDPANLAEMIDLTMTTLREWVSTKEVEPFFHEAQARHHPYGWVMTTPEVAANPQLEARDWWTPYPVGDAMVRGPGAPYHFSDTPWRVKSLDDPPASPSQGEAPQAEVIPHSGRPTTGPLEGIRILDFTHVLAGPFATRVLADMGADVVKIMSSTRAGLAGGVDHPYHALWNRNKRVFQLDLSRQEARDIARELALQADVVIDNFSVGVLDRWGIGYEAVSPDNPGVVYIGMSGMGTSGPWSKYVTYAPTVHALAGLTYLTGVPGRNDIGIGFSYNDHMAGLHGAVAVLAALEGRRLTGKGQRIDMSQFEVGVNFGGPALLNWFANGVAAEPVGNDPPWESWAPHAIYPCADADRWCAIAVIDDEQWSSLCRLMEADDWLNDNGLATVQGRAARRGEIDGRISQWTAAQDRYELMHRCQQAGVPAGVVQTGDDLVTRDPQLAQANMHFAYDDPHPDLGPLKADRLALRFEKTPATVYNRSEVYGESNLSVAADWLGMSADEVARLEAEGVVE